MKKVYLMMKQIYVYDEGKKLLLHCKNFITSIFFVVVLFSFDIYYHRDRVK